jgi:hypothetical protein
MINTRRNQHKKKKERQIIDQFRKDYPDFPKGKLMPSESPDFILRTGPKRTIGIELVSVIFSDESVLSFSQELDHTILQKEEKLPLYRKRRLDRYWLLLYTENSGGAVDLNRIADMNVTSAYHKIFFMYLPAPSIIVIK